MSPLQCVKNAKEAMSRNDLVMLKFWNDQYEYQRRTEKTKKIRKEALLECIKTRLSVRNPLTTPAYEFRANRIESKRHIYRK